jgi:hypothetical protein
MYDWTDARGKSGHADFDVCDVRKMGKGKSEIRNTKSETSSNVSRKKAQNEDGGRARFRFVLSFSVL